MASASRWWNMFHYYSRFRIWRMMERLLAYAATTTLGVRVSVFGKADREAEVPPEEVTPLGLLLELAAA